MCCCDVEWSGLCEGEVPLVCVTVSFICVPCVDAMLNGVGCGCVRGKYAHTHTHIHTLVGCGCVRGKYACVCVFACVCQCVCVCVCVHTCVRE